MQTPRASLALPGLARSLAVIIGIGCVTSLLWFGLFFVLKFITPVLFFKGCLASLGTLVICCGVALFATYRGLIRGETLTAIVGLVGLYLGFIMTLFVVFPVSYDRSVSIFLLARIAASGKDGTTRSELESELINKYVIEHGAVERRIREQLITGTIERTNGERFTLSPGGKRLLCINPILESFFGYTNRELSEVCN